MRSLVGTPEIALEHYTHRVGKYILQSNGYAYADTGRYYQLSVFEYDGSVPKNSGCAVRHVYLADKTPFYRIKDERTIEAMIAQKEGSVIKMTRNGFRKEDITNGCSDARAY